MRFISIATVLIFLLTFSTCLTAQSPAKPTRTTIASDDLRAVKSSAAYAELLVRMTELSAEVESLMMDYTDEFPKVKDDKMELELLSSEMDRLLSVKSSDAQKLTTALGKLILGKVTNQTKLLQLRLQYADEHPSVRRQRKIVEVYEAAIKEILG
ncbi:MAG: hypothetical protein ACRD6X_11055 [Pyrinomonadaceae bacterium]